MESPLGPGRGSLLVLEAASMPARRVSCLQSALLALTQTKQQRAEGQACAYAQTMRDL
jgi:hypothetical protein